MFSKKNLVNEIYSYLEGDEYKYFISFFSFLFLLPQTFLLRDILDKYRIFIFANITIER